MSYWLCLSFLYHRYRGDCKIRAYADDHQVGEITLTDSIGLKTVSLEGSPVKARVQSKHPVCHVHILPEKLYMAFLKLTRYYAPCRGALSKLIYIIHMIWMCSRYCQTLVEVLNAARDLKQ